MMRAVRLLMWMGAMLVIAGPPLGASRALAQADAGAPELQPTEQAPAPEADAELADELPLDDDAALYGDEEDDVEPDRFRGIEEITVTATKRSESLQDVPVSVTALNARMIRDTDLSQFSRLQNFVPNLQILPVTDSRSTAIRIRGIGSVGNNAGIDPAVGTFIDGVYQGRAGMSVTDLLDIESVQVLRGPQGTLFGKNTTAGAILIDTKRPVYDWETYLEVLFGTYSNYEIRGSINAPIIEDKLAMRFSGYRVWREGFDRNRLGCGTPSTGSPGDPDYDPGNSGYLDALNGDCGELVNNSNKWGARGKILWDITPELSILVSGDYNKDGSKCCVGDIITYEGPSVLGTTFQNIVDLPGRVPLAPEDPFDQIVGADVEPKNRVTTAGAAIELDWDIGDYSIKFLNAYRKYLSDSQFDGDFSIYNAVIAWADVDLDQFSSELTLNSPDNERYNYTLGAYFFYMNMLTEDRNGYEEDFTEANTFLFGLIGPSYNINTNDHRTRTVAGYGEGSYHFIPEVLSLTGGARVTWEKKTRYGESNGTCPTFIDAPPICGPVGEDSIRDEGRAVTNVSGRLMMRYWPPVDRILPSDDFMIFGSFATGFKSGGFNQDRTNLLPSEFDDEKALSYELGIKTTWFDRRVTANITGFYTDYADFQAQVFDGASISIRNACCLFSTGFEAEFMYMPWDQLTLGLNLGFNIAEYEEFDQAAATVPQQDARGQANKDANGITNAFPNALWCSTQWNLNQSCVPFQNLSGKVLDKAPEWDVSLNVAYEEEVPWMPIQELMFFARADYNYNSPIFLDQDLDPNIYQEGRHLLDLRAGFRRNEGVWKMQDWEAAFWVRNVTDEGYHVVGTDVPIVSGYFGVNGPPRQIGATFRVNF